MNERQALRLFAAPPAEVEEARKRLTREQCPRRYCWYWHSLSFDWDLKHEEGCGVANGHICDALLMQRGAEVGPWRQCCRASGNPEHPDYYEPREPHLEADGWSVDFFQIVGKAARRRRFERRQRGKRRGEQD
jgi:hypothetical protein